MTYIELGTTGGHVPARLSFQQLWARLSLVPGWLEREEAAALYRLAAQVRAGWIVEVGAYQGRSTIALAYGYLERLRQDDGKGSAAGVLTVDTFRGSAENQPGQSCFSPTTVDMDSGEVNLLPGFSRNMKAFGLSGIVQVRRAHSTDAARDFQQTVGLLFVDGDHAYAAVRADLDAWCEHIVAGGIVVLHDVGGWDGPTQVAAELLRQGYVRIEQVRTALALGKPGGLASAHGWPRCVDRGRLATGCAQSNRLWRGSKMAEVSIVMSVFNADVTILREAFNSILGQTLSDWELVVVDDGSTCAATREFLAGMERTDSRVSLLTLQHNMGIARAANAGLARAQCELVARMDADDVMLPERLRVQRDYLVNHPEVDVLGAQVEAFGDQHYTTNHPQEIGPDVYASSLWFMNNPTVMFRRSRILALGGYEERDEFVVRNGQEDYKLWSDCIAAGYILRNLPQVLLRLRCHGASCTATWDHRRVVQYQRIMRADTLRRLQVAAAGPAQMTFIPRVLHQVWIGPNPPPEEAMETWRRAHPDWEYRFWDEAALKRHWPDGLRNQAQYDAMEEWNGKCDIARYEILYEFGGVYVDADSICLRPLDEWLLENDSFACYENEWVRPGLIASGVLATTKNNQLARLLVDGIGRKTGNELWQGPGTAWMTVGPHYLTQTVRQSRYTKIAVYPSFFFLPRHYTGVYYDGPARPYADHHWGSTRELAKMRGIPIS